MTGKTPGPKTVGKPARPLKPDEMPDQLTKAFMCISRQEALVDEAIEESFPASDPPSPKVIS